MCKIGDIIVIKKFKNETGKNVSQHSFVVINDERDFIESIEYDFVATMLCSFHNNKHKKQKLKYKSNYPIKERIFGKSLNAKTGYIKANQLYYFNKSQIKYKVIANISNDMLNELIKLIIELRKVNQVTAVYTNLK